MATDCRVVPVGVWYQGAPAALKQCVESPEHAAKFQAGSKVCQHLAGSRVSTEDEWQLGKCSEFLGDWI